MVKQHETGRAYKHCLMQMGRVYLQLTGSWCFEGSNSGDIGVWLASGPLCLHVGIHGQAFAWSQKSHVGRNAQRMQAIVQQETSLTPGLKYLHFGCLLDVAGLGASASFRFFLRSAGLPQQLAEPPPVQLLGAAPPPAEPVLLLPPLRSALLFLPFLSVANGESGKPR